ncbi:hypothetical protein N9937_00545 [bacterium]|nr:hypothetical protein [bacterium]
MAYWVHRCARFYGGGVHEWYFGDLEELGVAIMDMMTIEAGERANTICDAHPKKPADAHRSLLKRSQFMDDTPKVVNLDEINEADEDAKLGRIAGMFGLKRHG